jgi:hypothetical protein
LTNGNLIVKNRRSYIYSMIKKRIEYFSPKFTPHNTCISSVYIEQEIGSVDELYFAVLPYYDAANGGRASVMILQEHFNQIMEYFQKSLAVHVRGMGKATPIDESTYIPRLESTYFEAST